MQREVKLLVSAIALGVCAVAMFFAAGAFYTELRHIQELCAQYQLYGPHCYVNESIWMAATSYRIGTATFSLMGIGTWATAVYVAFKWHRGDRVGS